AKVPARPQRGAGIGAGGAPPAAPARRELDPADALLAGAVVIGAGREARTDRGLFELGKEEIRGVDRYVTDRAGCTVIETCAAPAPLEFLEVGQHIAIAPSLEPPLAPAVVVAPVAAHVDQSVDRRAAAQCPPAPDRKPALAEPGLGLGLEGPDERAVARDP